jgi:hypothetical protein
MKHLGSRWKLQLSHFMKTDGNGTQVEEIHDISFLCPHPHHLVDSGNK